jgi:hypothetical protein
MVRGSGCQDFSRSGRLVTRDHSCCADGHAGFRFVLAHGASRRIGAAGGSDFGRRGADDGGGGRVREGSI